MSLQSVRTMVSELPRSLADQIVGYAESVDRALPEIFRGARRRQTSRIKDQLVFLAGVKKLHWLASSSYWTLENSGKLLAAFDIASIRIGGSDVSRGGAIYDQLHALLTDLDECIGADVQEYLRMSWSELVRTLASE